jgi:hypothetical protein
MNLETGTVIYCLISFAAMVTVAIVLIQQRR